MVGTMKYDGLLLLILISVTSHTLAQNSLMPEKVPSDWHAMSRSQELVWTGSSGTPEINFEKSKLISRPHVIRVITNARSIVIGSGATKFSVSLMEQNQHLKVHRGPVNLGLDGRPDSFRIELDGESVDRVRGAWARIAAKEEAESVQLSFSRATYVTLQLDPARAGAEGSGRAAEVGWHHVNFGTAPQSFIDKVSPSLLRIQVQHGDQRQRINLLTAGIALGEGFLATHASLLEGASSASLIHASADNPIPLTLWAFDRSKNLALLRLPEGQDYPDGISAVTLSDKTPVLNRTVWVVGEHENEWRFNKATLLSRPRTTELATAHDLQTAYDSRALWLETDAFNDEPNSAGMLFDDEGRMLGMTTFLWLKRHGFSYALSVAHIYHLMKHRPDEPVGLASFVRPPVIEPNNAQAGAVQYTPEVRLPHGVLPDLVIPEEGNMSSLLRYTNALRPLIGCRVCNNAGVQVVEVRVGTKRRGNMVVPVMEKQERVCTQCNGTRINRPDRLVNQIELVVREMAAVDWSGEESARALQNATDNLRDVAGHHPDGLAELMNLNVADRLRLQQCQIADTITAIGTVVDNKKLIPADLLGYHLIGVPHKHGVTYLFVDDAVIDEARPGNQVLIGGIISSFLTNHENQLIPVLQRGVIVTAAEEK